VPLFDGLARAELQQRLSDVHVVLEAPEELAPGEPLGRGYLFAANHLARIYPTLTFICSETCRAEAAALVEAINPQITISDTAAENAPRLRFAADAPRAGEEVTAWASGWNVGIDGALSDATEEAAVPSALAVAAIGVGEIFRIVFADLLEPPRARVRAQPGSLNLITLDQRSNGLPIDLNGLNLGRVHLIGCGAIGEAFVEALCGIGVAGTLVAVDPEPVEESNLQRYVLTTDADEGSSKTALVRTALSQTPLNVEEVEARWGEDAAARLAVEVAAVAVDTPEDRIGVAASLPARTYNAFTQQLDLGWSRHEQFGAAPCLACLYWPIHESPGRHEVIGEALKQPPRRVLAYLAQPWPVGRPLVRQQLGDPDPPSEEDAHAWISRALLDDVLERFERPPSERSKWAERDIEDLYRDGICGGAILGNTAGDGTREVLVPLAHQSALAGVLLAVQILAAAKPELAGARPPLIEGRFDVLRGFPQSPAVPTARSDECVCSDNDFVSAWASTYK
jgi:hypothetical protein